MMIDINIYSEKFDIASQQKQNIKYKSIIKNNLKKVLWQNRKFEIDKLVSEINTTKDFEKYQKELAILFDDLYQVITAPGVDDFIGWIKDITENINETNTKKLYQFLVEHFSNIKISDAIELINFNKDFILFDNNESFLFHKLLKEVRKSFKNMASDFLNKSKEFENGIDEFLELLGKRLLELNQTEELKFKDKTKLYSIDQIKNNIEWYDDIIAKLLNENQSLKPINENEIKDGEATATKTKRRINDIKACINVLDKTGIANNSDELLKKIFLKFTDEMIKFEGGVKDNLEEFLEKKWSEVESNYKTIAEFFISKADIQYRSEWDSYPQKEEIEILTNTYNNIIKDNPLQKISTLKNASDIQKILKNKVKDVNEFTKSMNNIKINISNFFEEIIKEYSDKNIPLLTNLALTNSSLTSKIEIMKQQLVGLKNGKKSLMESTDVLIYLNESFNHDLNSYTELSNLFTKALQESGKREHLNWLETKLNETGIGNLNEADFGNQKIIKELLADGLIKINIEKLF